MHKQNITKLLSQSELQILHWSLNVTNMLLSFKTTGNAKK